MSNSNAASVQIIAHTGTYEFPENTMGGLRRAVEVGADMIEVDLRLSKDGVAVVFHDQTLYRMTDGAGYVIDKTYEELRRLRVGDTDEYIPTLAEIVALPIPLNIEVKILGLEDQVVARSYSSPVPHRAADGGHDVPLVLLEEALGVHHSAEVHVDIAA